MPPVRDLMTKTVISIDVDKTILEAAVIMSKKMKGCLVITDGKSPVGIVTERDFVRRAVAKKQPLDVKISEIMSKPLITIDPGSSIRKAARLMLKNEIRRLPVVKDEKLIGIIVVSDFAKQLSKKTITEEILNALARYPPIIPYEW